MKKKVLFLISTLGGGGAEKVLTDIIRHLDKEKYYVTVMSRIDFGIYIDEVKKYAEYRTFFKALETNRNIFISLFNIMIKVFRLCICNLPMKIFYGLMIREKYDIEIAFLEDLTTKVISYSNNKKSKKIAWVHTDMESFNWGLRFYKNIEKQGLAYKRFDKVVCVSETVKAAFEKAFGFNENVVVQYNPIDEENIILKSYEEVEDLYVCDKFKIISIGRLSEEKGYDRLLEVHKRLIEDGFDYKLLILGEGLKRKELEEFININKLGESVNLLGFKNNPYKYLRKADLFICSSRTEGYSTVVAEAIILGIPVISTDCAGANELLGFGRYGYLAENNTESLYQAMKKLLSDKDLYNSLKVKALEGSNLYKLSERIKELEYLIDN